MDRRMDIQDTLNKEQREAVLHLKGPLLILAGAGSGKTRVLTATISRVNRSLNYGNDGYDMVFSRIFP